MIGFLFDEDYKHQVVRGLRRRRPDILTLRVQETELSGAHDLAILEYAAEQDIVVVTHDANTMIQFAYSKIALGQKFSGLLVARQNMPIGAMIDELILIADATQRDEWKDRVRFLPLR